MFPVSGRTPEVVEERGGEIVETGADEHAGHACHGVCHARGAKHFLGQGKVKMSNYPLKRSRPRKSRVT